MATLPWFSILRFSAIFCTGFGSSVAHLRSAHQISSCITRITSTKDIWDIPNIQDLVPVETLVGHGFLCELSLCFVRIRDKCYPSVVKDVD